MRSLKAGGAKVSVQDPLYEDGVGRSGLHPVRLGEKADAVIIQLDHIAYRHPTRTDLPSASVVLDGHKILRDGQLRAVHVVVIGEPIVIAR